MSSWPPFCTPLHTVNIIFQSLAIEINMLLTNSICLQILNGLSNIYDILHVKTPISKKSRICVFVGQQIIRLHFGKPCCADKKREKKSNAFPNKKEFGRFPPECFQPFMYILRVFCFAFLSLSTIFYSDIGCSFWNGEIDSF